MTESSWLWTRPWIWTRNHALWSCWWQCVQNLQAISSNLAMKSLASWEFDRLWESNPGLELQVHLTWMLLFECDKLLQTAKIGKAGILRGRVHYFPLFLTNTCSFVETSSCVYCSGSTSWTQERIGLPHMFVQNTTSSGVWPLLSVTHVTVHSLTWYLVKPGVHFAAF